MNIEKYNSRYSGPRWKEKPAKKLPSIYSVQSSLFFTPLIQTAMNPNPNKYGYDGYVPQYGETGHVNPLLAVALGAAATALTSCYAITPPAIIAQAPVDEAEKLKLPPLTSVPVSPPATATPMRPVDISPRFAPTPFIQQDEYALEIEKQFRSYLEDSSLTFDFEKTAIFSRGESTTIVASQPRAGQESEQIMFDLITTRDNNSKQPYYYIRFIDKEGRSHFVSPTDPTKPSSFKTNPDGTVTWSLLIPVKGVGSVPIIQETFVPNKDLNQIISVRTVFTDPATGNQIIVKEPKSAQITEPFFKLLGLEALTQPQSPAETLVSSLLPLPGYGWSINKEGTILLVDTTGKPVATYDEKAGGVLRVSPDAAAAFAKMDDAAKTQFLKANTGIINVVILPGIPNNGNTPPPFVTMLDAKGNVKTVQGIRGVADFAYDAKEQKIAGRFADGTNYYFVNPDGSLDMTPLLQTADEIADKMTYNFSGAANPEQSTIWAKDAVRIAVQQFPYGITADEVRDLYMQADARNGGRDIEQYFNERYEQYNITWKELMDQALPKSPNGLLSDVRFIGSIGRCINMCFSPVDYSIRSTDAYIRPDAQQYVPSGIIKEGLALALYKRERAMSNKAARQGFLGSSKESNLLGTASFAIEVAFHQLYKTQGHQLTSDFWIEHYANDAYIGGYVVGQ